jgi:hypothetical protein
MIFILKVRVSITVHDQVAGNPAKVCGESIRSTIDEAMLGVNKPSCGNTTFQPPSDSSDGQTACSSGFVNYSADLAVPKCCKLVLVDIFRVVRQIIRSEVRIRAMTPWRFSWGNIKNLPSVG